MDKLPVDDRGLAYGDGLFETILVRDGKPLLWQEHVARLSRGCERLGMPMPLADELDRLPALAGPGLKVLKLILTRGSGGRGYLTPPRAVPRLIWQVGDFAPLKSHWETGVRVRHCRLQLGIQPLLAGLKHLNRLENVLARSEWNDTDIAEGILCDSQGHLVEATCMNLFWQWQGRLQTPSLEGAGVAGTLRAALMERLEIQEVSMRPEALVDAEAVWLGNSVQGIWPVVRLDAADGAMLRSWALGGVHRVLQSEAHELLGYPVVEH
ncbi:aminodeoxychorismate lyase [Billgrantia sp. LNSP4103-1]|uniref:aminodeoxychorismate lyase n=1 Tax=Billgrantia sp. LNSP4103-1 TaxID=3410266 RepID=UPI00403F9EBF